MIRRIAVLAGDGIGPEVMDAALKVLRRVDERFKLSFEFKEALIGGAAFEKYSAHFPEETRKICSESDAILFGSVGGPISEAHLEKWRGCESNSILALRKALGLFANLRPIKVYPELRAISPIKGEVIGEGIDILIVRELAGDIYFGEHRTFEKSGCRYATDLAEYDENQIAAIGRVAFETARSRRKKVTSVDKANVLATSKLWRGVIKEISQEFSEIEYEDMLVDNCAMQIIRRPSDFDVIVTSNMFGDILSDAAAVLPGSLGLTPSASLNAERFGLYEPSGGSAPDIAGRGVANPIAQILSAALLLRFSFGLEKEALSIEDAVYRAIAGSARTVDIAVEGESALSTAEFTDKVLSHI
ncbi:MAG: 3-isopropylmalate dehydrogenase [Deltaproteobacteria bacterium]|nr:3-isopropylmalate dehydrogenase [Deltaproteobacteria bacterium]